MSKDLLKIADKTFSSRLFVGTGKFGNLEVMQKALRESGTQIVTVAMRRIEIGSRYKNIFDYLEKDRYLILPNTAGAKDAEEAVKLALIARAAGLPNWIKLEVTPDPRYLLPDPVETLKAAEILIEKGFIVLPYINADPVLAKKLEDIGTATVMPLAAPIGTNKGLKTLDMIKIIIEQATVPVVVDAGLGLPSHANAAMELGADAVLVNTAIATASDPIKMAKAFKLAVESGRMAYLSKPRPPKDIAEASSPVKGFIKSLKSLKEN